MTVAVAAVSDLIMHPKTWIAGHRQAEATPFFERLCPAMTQLEARDFKRSSVLFLKALVLDDVETRIDQLAA
jgi:hypothetical protein